MLGTLSVDLDTTGYEIPIGYEERLVTTSIRADDSDLWSRLSAMDPEAIGLLFDRHSKAVYNFAFRRTASWSTAEEIVQATLTTVWRKAAERSLPALDP